jgi:nitroreductase
MDVSEAIAKRRSIRTYKKQDLPQGTVEKLLEAAKRAPSAGNVQPWEFVVLSTQKGKQDVAAAAFGKNLSKKHPL